jgi:prepilin-type N-terminal cleavage/methylation domain-containing protein
MKTNYKPRRGFTLVELLVVIVIIAALAGLTAPMVIRQRKKADQTEAVNNARQIGFALIEFETEYSTFPDSLADGTGKEVTDRTGNPVKSGTTSNALLQQLFAAGMTQSEAMFYCKSSYTKKPDGVINTETKTLDKGECGFGMITNGTAGFSTAGNPGRPICAAPFAIGMDGTFDPDFFDGKAVILKVDNSVSSLVINKTSKRVSLNQKDLLDNAKDSLFEGTTPQWAYPEKK